MTSAKRTLHFDDFDAIIAELTRLRNGKYTKLGNWSLEQMCFHLASPIPQPLRAVPADPKPPVNAELITRFQHYADHDAPLPGITAPPGTLPGESIPTGIVDDLMARLKAVDAFAGAYVDLGPRGPVPTDVYKPFIRGHCAHHLSYLIPSP
ncbi:MAG: DUF1569 domain-containing protein [Tepidisphaeraceae bacterium]